MPQKKHIEPEEVLIIAWFHNSKPVILTPFKLSPDPKKRLWLCTASDLFSDDASQYSFGKPLPLSKIRSQLEKEDVWTLIEFNTMVEYHSECADFYLMHARVPFN